MISELLVLIACAQSQGCSQTTTAYYLSHPEMKQNIKAKSTSIKNTLGPDVVAISPAILFAVRHRATFSLNKYLSLQISDQNEKMILLKFTF